MELRPYQSEAREAVYSWFANRSDPTLVDLPTGSGKSLCIADLITSVLRDEPGEHILVLSHRREILAQDAARLQALMPNISLGVFSAGLGQKRLRQVTVAGIQSIVRVPRLPPFKLIIVDEVHLLPPSGDGMYRKVITKLLDAEPDARIVGYSATCWRNSGYLHQGDNALFTGICYQAKLKDLVDAGFLVPLVTKLTHTQADLTGVHIRAGEFAAGEAEAAMDKAELTRAAVEEICRYGADRSSWLAFCAGVNHAEHVCDALRAAGIDARCLFGHTDMGTRDRLLRDFKTQRLRCLVSVSAITTGFDAPCTDLIAVLRPIASSSLWVQALGRGMRPSPETGKTDCLVLDFADCCRRCGMVDDPIVPGQSRKKGEKKEPPVKICPTCQTALATATRSCPDCGHEWEFEETQKHASTAVARPVMSTEAVPPATLPVLSVSYKRHTKIGKPDSFRVDYSVGGFDRVSDWVCFEHEGMQAKAWGWWRRNAHVRGPVPATVSDALERTWELKRPMAIVVRQQGKFQKVVRVVHDDAPAETVKENSFAQTDDDIIW